MNKLQHREKSITLKICDMKRKSVRLTCHGEGESFLKFAAKFLNSTQEMCNKVVVRTRSKFPKYILSIVGQVRILICPS